MIDFFLYVRVNRGLKMKGIVDGANFSYANENDYDSSKTKNWSYRYSIHYRYDIRPNAKDASYRGTGDRENYKAADNHVYGLSSGKDVAYELGGVSAKSRVKKAYDKFVDGVNSKRAASASDRAKKDVLK